MGIKDGLKFDDNLKILILGKPFCAFFFLLD